MAIETRLTPEMIDEYHSKGFWGNKTIGDYLDDVVLKYPNHLAVVDAQGRQYSYRELGDVVNRLMLGFRHLGIKKGDVVSVQLPGWVYFTGIYFALAKIGAIINPFIPNLRHKEIEYIANFSESVAIVVPSVFRGFDYAGMIAALRPRLSTVKHVFIVGDPVPEGMISFDEYLQTRWEDQVPAPGFQDGPTADDILDLMYTSGTESMPKGALHTHNSAIFGELSLAEALGMSQDDVVFMPSPLGHAIGFYHGVTLPMLLGGTSVLLDVWEPEAGLKMMEKYRTTCSMAATPFLRMILDCPNLKQYDIGAMRFFLSGGAPIPREIVLEYEKIGLRVLALYGSTESVPHTVCRRTDPPEKIYTTDGKATPGVEVKVVDDQRGEVPVGVLGEESSRGPHLFMGYFRQPEITKKSFDAEGWFYSGDLCRMDQDGYITIDGRKKDIVIRGGENISVREVEDLIRSHPKIYNVACVAMPDAVMGEKVCAYVVMNAGETITFKELVSYLLEKQLAKFKLPERLEIVAEFPMTATGKIQKVELRKDVAKKLALETQGK